MKKYIFLIPWVFCMAHSNAKQIEERLKIISDRHVYIAGEDIYVSLFNIDNYNHPSALSTVAYVELWGENGRESIMSVFLKGGKGSLIIKTSDRLPTGNYLVRAYTYWMQNYNQAHFAHYRITVYNTINEVFAAFSKDSTQNLLPEKATKSIP
ncbi:MAG: hypothetical protein HC896_17025, partial [Bacteroidales bacterium]|nr:hypothetical protein [Bacteroidales bacterium]